MENSTESHPSILPSGDEDASSTDVNALTSALRRMHARSVDRPATDPLNPTDPRDDDESEDRSGRVTLDYEMPRSSWIAQTGTHSCNDAPYRFIDGTFRAHVTMVLADPRDRFRPVILAPVGAIALDLVRKPGGQYRLQRSAYIRHCRAYTLADGLDMRDLELMRRALARSRIDLVPAVVGEIPNDFDAARQRTLEVIRRDMLALESELLRGDPSVPTVVDGLLDQRIETFASHNLPAVGVVKRQLRTYLHRAGVALVSRLAPGERSPAFLINTTRGEYVSFYLRLSPVVLLPTDGIVRVMLSRQYYEDSVGARPAFLDGLAYWLCRLRCTRTSYARAAVSLEPIVHAEEQIQALLPQVSERVGAFHGAMPLRAPTGMRIA